MDKETRDILSINKIKRDAQKKRMGVNRKPGESLAAFVTRAKKHKEKMQKEETEEDRIRKHADRINKEKSQGLSKTQHKKAMAAADRIHRQRSMAAKRNEEVELDEVSASSLRSYVDKSRADKSRQQKARTVAKNDYKKYGIPSDKERADAAHRKASQRNTGISMAKRKLGGYTKGTEPKVLAREEVELDEAVMQGSKEHLKKLQGMLDKVKPGSADHSQIRGAIESKFGKQHIPAKHRNVKPDMYEEVELDENKSLIKDYQELKSQGKKDSAALDILMSMPKYKSMSKDKMRKAIGDARRKGVFKEEVNLQEDAWEEIPMMSRQLQFIMYAAQKIMSYLNDCDDMCVDPEEWFQNKLSHIHGQMQSLHAYVEGEHHRKDPEYDMEESYDIYEKLEVSDGIEAWIKDFYKSDAPQFKGKDKKERRDMAVAAYLSAKRKKEG